MAVPLHLTFLLLIISLNISYSWSYRCFTTHCPRSKVCIQTCPIGITTCHAARQSRSSNSHTPIEMGCTNTTSCNSTTCNFRLLESLATVEYCCCTGDLCNRIKGVTDPIDPSLSISTQSPTSPLPQRPNDTLICERFYCNPDRSFCYHGYEVCSETTPGLNSNIHDHSCMSSYIVNPNTNKFDLAHKGCIYSHFVDPTHRMSCNVTSSCHINNPLIGVTNTPYFCCCGETLCNANETFTHPTEVSNYGLDECNNANCSHACVIRNHTPSCYCKTGFALYNETECMDINECAVNNGGCDEQCINSEGSFTCDCNAGRSINVVTKKCEDNDGIICGYRQCSYSINNISNCPLEYEYCPTSERTPANIRDLYLLHYCQSTYYLINNTFIPGLLSCFPGAHNNCFGNKCVLSHSVKNVYHCCCYGDRCNIGDSLIFPSIPSSTPTSSFPSVPTSNSSTMSLDMSNEFVSSTGLPYLNPSVDSSPSDTLYPAIFGSLIALMLILFLVICFCLFFSHYFFKKKINHEQALANRTPSPLCFAEPQFIKVIGHGRFAEVYHARLDDGDVAIKIFNNTLPARGSWTQEKDIYMTENLAHDNILKFIGHENRLHEGRNTFWLIFDYHQNGSLYDYLQNNRINLDEFCTLSMSASYGLAHLHSDNTCIAHRDLKSKNILVKKNMTCCISDFGLAVRFAGNDNTVSETKGQVGTSRYMAPEVLQGAIMFNQISFLRIDVYAFGLILWEMASCCDLENTSSVPDYHPPFDGMVSSNPSIDEMKRVVVDKKLRPEVPQSFKANLSCTTIVDMINESLDGEGGARPSAQLIKRRLEQFHSNNFTSSSLTNIPSKESGFLSLGGPHPNGVGNPSLLPRSDSFNGSLPLTPTPSYSPTSITMSPTEIKSHRAPPPGSLYHVYPSSLPTSPQRQGLIMKNITREGGGGGGGGNRPTNLGFLSSSYAFSTSPDDSLTVKLSLTSTDGNNETSL